VKVLTHEHHWYCGVGELGIVAGSFSYGGIQQGISGGKDRAEEVNQLKHRQFVPSARDATEDRRQGIHFLSVIS
jgi:hypothetical protein